MPNDRFIRQLIQNGLTQKIYNKTNKNNKNIYKNTKIVKSHGISLFTSEIEPQWKNTIKNTHLVCSRQWQP